ncbi:hypothetical protein ES703_77174 [subsurface metagenome]
MLCVMPTFTLKMLRKSSFEVRCDAGVEVAIVSSGYVQIPRCSGHTLRRELSYRSTLAQGDSTR